MNAPTAASITGYNVAKRAAGTQFEELFDGVDDLIKRVADTENPEIRKIRARVHASMMAARSACEDRSAVRYPASGNAAVMLPAEEEYAGEALGVALLVGVSLGVIMSIQP